MKEVIMKILKWIVISVLCLFLLFDICIIIKSNKYPDEIPSILGYRPFIVMSKSMHPTIKAGDLILVKDADVSALEVNDIIAFRGDDKIVVTHRIKNVLKVSDDVCFETQGDSNNKRDDELVCSSMVVGKYVKRYAKLGSIILFIQQPLGFLVLMMGIFIIAMIIYLLENRKIDQENEEYMKEFEEFKRKKEQKKRSKK